MKAVSMIRRRLCVSSIILSVTLLSFGHATTLVDWDTGGIPAADGALENAEQPHPLLEAAVGNAAAGVTVSDLDHLGLVYSTAVAPGGVGTSIEGELNIKNFDTGGDGVNDNYIFLTITADAGFTVSLDSISIELWRNGGGAPDGMAFEISVDGGAFEAFGEIQTVAGVGGGVHEELTFEGSVTGANAVEIRFTPRHVDAGSTGNLHIDSLRVTGEVEGGGVPGFAVTRIERQAGGSVLLTWRSDPSPGTSYAIFFSPVLDRARIEWAEANDSISTGGTETTYVVGPEELNDPSAERLFFVVVENP
jgi:hypothetical protein